MSRPRRLPGSAAQDPDPAAVDRPAAAITGGLLVLLLAVAGAWLVPWTWTPYGDVPAVDERAVLTGAQLARSDAFSSTARTLSTASLVVSLAVVGILGLTSWGGGVTRWCGRRGPWWLVVPTVTAVVVLGSTLATAVFAVALWQHRLAFGLTEQSFGSWLGDQARGLLVDWAVSSLVVLVVVALARHNPRRWFLQAAPVLAGLVMAGSFAYPLVVEPLFNEFTPLGDGPLETEILRVADREGVEVDEVLVADASRRTTTLNAYVSGLGGSRRVVLFDNLLDSAPRREVLSVVAHELGHARHRDVLVGTMLGSLGAAAGVCLLAVVLDLSWVRRRTGALSAGDPRVTAGALAIVTVGMVLVLPLQNTVSRAIEARADVAALDATQAPGAFERVQRRLAVRSLADPTPPAWRQWWFGSHPTPVQRLGLAESWRRAHPEEKGHRRS